jgi:F0F1-type ATP synthase membrane subunit b/b'
MTTIYNYSRSQKEAEQEREKAQKALSLLGLIILLAIILLLVIIVISWLYRKNQKEKKERIAKLEESLNSAKRQRSIVQEELRKLKENDYEGIIAEKERQEAELTKAIERLQAEDSIFKHSKNKVSDSLDDFLDSKIAQLFVKKARGKSERPIPTEAEWDLLLSQFSKDNPATFKSFGDNKSLSQLEQRICILLILGISEKTISTMTASQASTVSNAKARANEKLFGKKEAHSLKTNLIHALRQA